MGAAASTPCPTTLCECIERAKFIFHECRNIQTSRQTPCIMLKVPGTRVGLLRVLQRRNIAILSKRSCSEGPDALSLLPGVGSDASSKRMRSEGSHCGGNRVQRSIALWSPQRESVAQMEDTDPPDASPWSLLYSMYRPDEVLRMVAFSFILLTSRRRCPCRSS